MPYIRQTDRRSIRPRARHLADAVDDVGELNYALTTIIDTLFERNVVWTANYAGLNSILGVLESVKFELQRRVVTPYENRKMRENGDVYHTPPLHPRQSVVPSH